MSIIWIYVMSRVRPPVGWLSFVTESLMLDIARKLFDLFFHTCHAY